MQIAKPANELDGLPKVRIEMFEDVPYVQVLSDSGRPIFDWSCTEALNVAMMLIEAAGTGHNTRIAWLEPSAPAAG